MNTKDVYCLGLPEGCIAYGKKADEFHVVKWMDVWRKGLRNLNFIVVLAGSKTAEVQGISAAGSTAYSRRFTALADAEFLIYGPFKKPEWNLPKLQAGFSPALITYIGSKFLDLKPLIISVGLFEESTFPSLYLESPSEGPAFCLSKGKAMEFARVKKLFSKAFLMGKSSLKPTLITECVPGGTTTAQAVMTALGLPVGDLMGSSLRDPPLALKRKLINKGLKEASLGKNPCPKKVIAAVGDPFQPVALGLLLGAREVDQPVILGGGSQMIAVLALALTTIDPSQRPRFLEGISIATTFWLAQEGKSSKQSKSTFMRLITLLESHFQVDILAISSGLRFENSTKKVLRDYEIGYVKEGVGAGSVACLAQLNGATCNYLVNACEDALDQYYSL